MFSKLAIEFREIHAQTIAKNRVDLLALTEQHRSGKLHRSIHGEKRVTDDFQARSCFGGSYFRAAGGHPGKLHLRSAEILDTPLRVKVSASALRTKLRRGALS